MAPSPFQSNSLHGQGEDQQLKSTVLPGLPDGKSSQPLNRLITATIHSIFCGVVLHSRLREKILYHLNTDTNFLVMRYKAKVIFKLY